MRMQIASTEFKKLMGVLSHQTSTYLALARFDLSEDFFRSLGELHSESIDVTGKTTKTTFNSLKYPKCEARLAQMLQMLRDSLWSSDSTRSICSEENVYHIEFF